MPTRIPLATTAAAVLACASACLAEWAPKEAPLMTRWAGDVSPDNVLPEYPRPQLVRQNWTNLNGLWDYALTDGGEQPDEWDGQILVPFPIESALSGVMQRVSPEQTLWYRRSLSSEELANAGMGERTVLHFGAVDWHATVYVNGTEVGQHKGGYDPFSFDITDALQEGDNELVVAVTDPTDTASQPHGKQFVEPRGIWYTPVTGIWQTVWLERVGASHIAAIDIQTDIDANTATLTVRGESLDDATLRVSADGRSAERPASEPFVIEVNDAKLWSPASPKLYDLTVELVRDGNVVDAVETYFAMRKVEVKADANGHNRIFLNNEPIFSFGLLDQGWWPDGLYTAPTDEALKYDLEMTKAWGFNTVRKHVKVEPARWYRHCDEMGLLVWQDMPSVFNPSPDWIRDVNVADAPEADFPPADAEQFRGELTELVRDFGHFPSIIMWVPFNERWGQHDTVETVKHIEELDPSRLVNAASGGNFFPAGNVLDVHNYPNPVFPRLSETMAVVCGEFGGLGWPIDGHLWQPDQNWGYRTYRSGEDLNAAYRQKIEMLPILIGQGLAGAIYTQTTDVEIEVNGLMTYDRAVIKVSPEDATALAAPLYETPRPAEVVVPDARDEALTWRYTFEQPADDWNAAAFDDEAWQQGEAGFGQSERRGDRRVIRTPWTGGAIWLRRTFELDDAGGDYYLTFRHDEDAKVYLNGVLALEADGFTDEYEMHAIRPEAREALRAGENTIAIECRQTEGGQYIDAGLVRLK